MKVIKAVGWGGKKPSLSLVITDAAKTKLRSNQKYRTHLNIHAWMVFRVLSLLGLHPSESDSRPIKNLVQTHLSMSWINESKKQQDVEMNG